MNERFPDLVDMLWFGREDAVDALSELLSLTNEFETDTAGRGESYRRAQRNQMVRAQGMMSLIMLAAGERSMKSIPTTWRLLDILGGNGLLARIFRELVPQAANAVITSDMAGQMVVDALNDGLPAIRQQAQFLFMRDESVDAVLIAYGAHHIPPRERLRACQEAARILRPGGRLVLHDFEEGSPVALWFSKVVHRYSQVGHEYHHYTTPELRGYLDLCGLRSVEVHHVYDPFVVRSELPGSARSGMADYILDMYGLTSLTDSCGSQEEARDAVWDLAQKFFQYEEDDSPESRKRVQKPVIRREDSGWIAEVPRIALVATGMK